jgi:hypothetical protein
VLGDLKGVGKIGDETVGRRLDIEFLVPHSRACSTIV